MIICLDHLFVDTKEDHIFFSLFIGKYNVGPDVILIFILHFIIIACQQLVIQFVDVVVIVQEEHGVVQLIIRLINRQGLPDIIVFALDSYRSPGREN